MTRIKNRIKGYLSFYGITLRADFALVQTHWSKNFIVWLEQIQMNSETGKETLMSMIRQLNFLKNELLIITKKLRTLMTTPEYKELYHKLQSIPGIGSNAAMLLISEICDIRRFKSVDKLSCFIGIIPNEYSSGESKRVGSLTSRGKSQLKQVLIEASWMAIRKDPYLTNYFNEAAKRMVKQKAIIKIARKLVSRIHHVRKTGEMYKFNFGSLKK
jgi:transposase